MPDQYWGFSFYLDALALMAVGFVGIALPLVAWLAARLVRSERGIHSRGSGAGGSGGADGLYPPTLR
jgi:hypothetical protein